MIADTVIAVVSIGAVLFMESSSALMLLIISTFTILCGLLFLLDLLHNRYHDDLLEQITLLIEALVEQQERVVFPENEDALTARLQHQLLKLREILISQNKLLESKKDQIKALISDISHQIKTPIASAKTFAELLSDNELSKKERDEYISILQESLNQLTFLTDSLIKMSRLESGIISLKTESVILNSIVLQSVKAIFSKAKVKNITITFDNDKQYKINLDFNWTAEAITNVLDNAVKYTQNGGKVDIKITDYPSYLRFDITDNGPGISEEEQAKVFSRFYRGKSSSGVEGVGMDYPYAPEGCKYFEQDYYDAIRDFYAERNFAFSEEEKRETIENDAKSFFYISIKNNFIPSFSIGDLKTVLLTSNTSLAIVSKKFAENERSIPFCVTDIFFGALIWKSNPKLVDLPSKQKLSNFLYQAYLPTDAMFEKFSSVISKSLEEQTITEEDCIVLKQNKSAAKLLVEITEGDIDRITINTPHDIMQSIRAKAKEEGRLEELERSSKIIRGKDEIISKTKQKHWQERVERNASDIRNTKALIKAKEETIKRIASERNNGQRIAKNAQKKVGGIIAIIMAVVIALAIILFDFGKKTNQDYFGLLGLVVSVIGAFAPYVICAFSNGKEFNPKKLFKTVYNKALNRYYVQHNCSDEIMLEEKSELDRLNELLDELKKKEQVDYFVE